MSYKKILTIQDISCFGQCSLTVALPILSAAGHETIILPSAVLSTHTGGFSGYTFLDLTEEIPLVAAHWKKENIKFDAVYTGYLGSIKQIGYIMDLMDEFSTPGMVRCVDPVMADNGKIYSAFDTAFVEEMKKLAATSQVLLPNITEAALLTDIPYKEKYGEDYVKDLVAGLTDLGAKTVILTGVSYEPSTTGVVVGTKDFCRYYRHKKIPKDSHGTGDVYASSFIGAYLRGIETFEAAKIAADYTVMCIEGTVADESHWYGVKFEPLLKDYIGMLAAGE